MSNGTGFIPPQQGLGCHKNNLIINTSLYIKYYIKVTSKRLIISDNQTYIYKGKQKYFSIYTFPEIVGDSFLPVFINFVEYCCFSFIIK